MLELVRTTTEISLDGKTYTMRMPTYKESTQYRQDAKAMVDDDLKSAQLIIDYLFMLGLPKEVTESLQLDHLLQILDFVAGTKKKST